MPASPLLTELGRGAGRVRRTEGGCRLGERDAAAPDARCGGGDSPNLALRAPQTSSSKWGFGVFVAPSSTSAWTK